LKIPLLLIKNKKVKVKEHSAGWSD